MALYYAGIQLAKQKQPAQALEIYLKVLALDPTNVRLAKRVADTYVLAGQPNEALAMLESMLKSNPDRPDVYIHLSEFCARNHNNNLAIKDRAFALAKEAVSRFPAEPRVYGNLIALHLLESQRDEAGAVVEKAAARNEPRASYWLQLAGQAAEVWSPRQRPENLAKVAGLYRRAEQAEPQDPSTRQAVADFFALHGQHAEALPRYESASAARPDDLKLREKLALTYSMAGRPDDAVATWKKLLAINPQSISVHQALAKFYAAKGDTAAAIGHRAEALRLGEAPLRDHLKLAADMKAAGKWREALTVLERAAFEHPDEVQPAREAGQVHLRLGQWSEAANALEGAVVATGFDLAAEPVAGAPPIAIDPELLAEWGTAVRRSGDSDRATRIFRRLIDLASREKPLVAATGYDGMARLWLAGPGKLAEAGPLIQRARKLAPEAPGPLATEGRLLFCQGDASAALPALEKAAHGAGDTDLEAQEWLAEALWTAGRMPEAIAQLEKWQADPRFSPAAAERLKTWKAGTTPAR